MEQNTAKNESYIKKTNIANPRYVCITKNNVSDQLSITNEGFRGMGIKKGLRYDFSMMYRQQSGNFKLHIEIINAKKEILASGVLATDITGDEWKKKGISNT